MLKTLKRKIALVAVAALGASGLSIIIAPAANAVIGGTTKLNMVAAGSTTAVTNSGDVVYTDGAAAETVYVRAGATSQKFIIDAEVAVAADVLHFTLTDSATAAATTANLVAITKGDNPTGGTCAQEAVTTVDNVASATTKGIACTVAGGATAMTGMSFTTGTLAAGTYYLYVDTDADVDPLPTLVATIKSYNVGTPASVAFDKKVTSIGLDDQNYKVSVKDSAARSTFLVGDEVINYSVDPVVAPIKTIAMTTTQTTAGSTPVLTGTTFAGYSVDLNSDQGGAGFDGNANDASAGTTYTINAVIQKGVVSYGTTTTTFRALQTTNGLQGTLSIIDAVAEEEVSTISLAQSDVIAVGDYKVKLVDSSGALVKGVTPTVTVSLGTGGGGASAATTDATTVATLPNALAAQYTAPATGTADSITWSLNAGTAGTISKTVTLSLIASVATNVYDLALEGSANGGYKEITDTARVDLSAGDAAYAAKVDPGTSTEITTEVELLTHATLAGKSGAVLNVELTNSTTPSANRTASATSITTDASGKASVKVTVAAPRNGETIVVDIKSGATLIGTATYTFETAAATISTISAGPAQAISQKAGTATPVTVTVVDQYGNALKNKRIQLSVTGPSAPASSPVLLTDATGVANYTVTGTTAVAGQTDVVTVTHYDAGAVTAEANDIVTITYTSADISVSTITAEYSLDQVTPNYATEAAAPIATAILAANAGGGAANDLLKFLSPDTAGNWTDDDTQGGIANTPAADEVVLVRFTVKNAAGSAIGGQKVTITTSAGAKIVNSLGTALVETRDIFSNASGQVVVTVLAEKVGDAVFTATVGTATGSMTIPYGTYNPWAADSRIVTLTPATASVASGNAQLMTAKVTDRFGNPVKGATVTFTEVGTGRLTGTPAVTSSAGTSEVDFTTLLGEAAGTSTVTATITGYQELNEADKVGTTTGTKSAPYTTGAPAGVGSASATLTVTAAAATAAQTAETTAIKNDVKAVSDTVATLSKAVTTVQSSVTELTTSFATQIKSLTSAIAKISKAIAAIQKSLKKK